MAGCLNFPVLSTSLLCLVLLFASSLFRRLNGSVKLNVCEGLSDFDVRSFLVFLFFFLHFMVDLYFSF